MSRRKKESYLALLPKFQAELSWRRICDNGKLPSLDHLHQITLERTGSQDAADRLVGQVKVQQWANRDD